MSVWKVSVASSSAALFKAEFIELHHEEDDLDGDDLKFSPSPFASLGVTRRPECVWKRSFLEDIVPIPSSKKRPVARVDGDTAPIACTGGNIESAALASDEIDCPASAEIPPIGPMIGLEGFWAFSASS